MQTNSNGEVALRYMRGGQKLFQGKGLSQGYVFIPKANISLAWVKPEDVEKMYRIKRGCCGSEKRVIFPATEDAVRQWTNNGGR